MDSPLSTPPVDPSRIVSPRPDRRRCKWCEVSFQPVRLAQDFHSDTCRRKWWSLARGRAGQIYELAYRWRKHRKDGKGKGLLSEIAHIVDQWIIEDREAEKK